MNQALFTSNSEEWATPQDLFDRLDAEFHFTLDPCSTDENAKCKKHFTKAQDGLVQDWSGETVWCNPPYGKTMRQWIAKCYQHYLGGVPLLCSSPQEQIQPLFTSIFGEKPRSGLSVVGCVSAGAKTMLPSLQ